MLVRHKVFARRLRVPAASLALALLAGCGRYGPLEPPGAPVAANDRHDVQTRHVPPPITPPHKDFVLDPLLQ